MSASGKVIIGFALVTLAVAQIILFYLTYLPFVDKPSDEIQRPLENYLHSLRQDLTLEELTGNPRVGSISCPSPLIPIYDRVVNQFGLPPRKIPRNIHVSMKDRCMPPDIVDATLAWKEAFPYHSFYFHDDNAVDRLFSLEWQEFPHLNKFMKCVRFKGAMKIDIWRLLVVYRYGGIYTDIDNIPGLIDENAPITNEDEAFFLSDYWDRPSQWFFAMVPKHPVAYYALYAIFARLQELERLEKPNVVFITGPEPFKRGYGAALGWGKRIYDPGTHKCKFNKTATKYPYEQDGKPWVANIDLNSLVPWNATENVTRRERMERQHGVVHWKKAKRRNNVTFDGTCMDFILASELGLEDTSGPWATS